MNHSLGSSLVQSINSLKEQVSVLQTEIRQLGQVIPSPG